MTSILLEPALTGPLLLALTRGPASIRAHLERYLADWNIGGLSRGVINAARLITALKWLFALGIVRRSNGALNAYARNHWTWGRRGEPWEFGSERKEVAIVTGGCSGFGYLISKGLAEKMMVVALDISDCPADLANMRGVRYYKCDITDQDAVRNTAATVRREVGTPSILINNAGIANSHTILDTSPAWLDKLFRVNLYSHYLLLQEFLPAMLANRKGHVLALASMASYFSCPGIVDYCATKAAVLALHEGLNQELKHRYGEAGRCIDTSVVHPMWARTAIIDSWEGSLAAAKTAVLSPEAIADRVIEQILSGRGGQIYVPASATNFSGLRGWPTWIQELVRDSTQAATAVIKEKSETVK